MANLPISGLPQATSLDGTEILPFVQGGVTTQATAQDIPSIASLIQAEPGMWQDGWEDDVINTGTICTTSYTHVFEIFPFQHMSSGSNWIGLFFPGNVSTPLIQHATVDIKL